MAAPMDFTGQLTLAMQVKDWKKARDWYQSTLGFTLEYEMEHMGWCELNTPVTGVNVGISQVENPKVGAGPVPTFGVADIDAARAHLESRDVRFDGETQTIPDMVRLATFYDPDGNALMLFQMLGQPPA